MFWVFSYDGRLINYFLTERDAVIFAGSVRGAFYATDFDLTQAQAEQVREFRSRRKGRMF